MSKSAPRVMRTAPKIFARMCGCCNLVCCFTFQVLPVWEASWLEVLYFSLVVVVPVTWFLLSSDHYYNTFKRTSFCFF